MENFTQIKAFTTIKTESNAVYEIRRSRFIAQAAHKKTEDEARAFLACCKKTYYDARHSPSAWVLGKASEKQKSNDDGEPGGTAGNPILEMIKKRGLTDTIVVVTRYFGGIKLGAGGLIRAYGTAAQKALEAAVYVRFLQFTRLAVTVDYALLPLVENFVRQEKIQTENTIYEQDVTFFLLLEKEQLRPIEAALTEITAGRAAFKQQGTLWGKCPI